MNSWARQLQKRQIQEGCVGGRSTELHGSKGEQEVLFVDHLAKDVLDNLPSLPLQISRTAAGLQTQLGQSAKHIFEPQTHEQELLLGCTDSACAQTSSV